MGKGKNGKKKKGKSDKDTDKKKAKASLAVTRVIAPQEDAPTLKTSLGSFALEDRVLPQWIEDRAFKSGGYPYDEPIKRKLYEEELTRLQVELVKLQRHVADTGMRLVLVFEGRDAAGKGGAIIVIHQYLNPRAVRAVALPK